MQKKYYSVVEYYADNKLVKTLSMKTLENIVDPEKFWDNYKKSLKDSRVLFVEIDGKIINRCAVDYEYAVHYLEAYEDKVYKVEIDIIKGRLNRMNLLIDGGIVCEMSANATYKQVTMEACRIISDLYFEGCGLMGRDFEIECK